MWYELIWNVEFLQGLIHIGVGVLAAIIMVPWILRRMEARRNRRLAKELLREWSGNCVSAIALLYSNIVKEEEEMVVQVEKNIDGIWGEIINAERDPEGSGVLISNAISQGIHSDEEENNNGMRTKKIYGLEGDLVIERSLIKSIVDPMYAKIEIFNIEWLPIEDMEVAMSYLNEFSELRKCTGEQLMTCVNGLAGSMEMFEKYIWRLDNWARLDSEYGDFTRNRSVALFVRLLRRYERWAAYLTRWAKVDDSADEKGDRSARSASDYFARFIRYYRKQEKEMLERDALRRSEVRRNKETRDRLKRWRRFSRA